MGQYDHGAGCPGPCTLHVPVVTLSSPAHRSEDTRQRRRTRTGCTTSPPEPCPPRGAASSSSAAIAWSVDWAPAAWASVYEAHDEHLDRDVAVKRVPVDAERPGDKAGKRAAREAVAAARLGRAAIVALYEAGRDDDGWVLVSELVQRPDARAARARRRAVGPRRLCGSAPRCAMPSRTHTHAASSIAT